MTRGQAAATRSKVPSPDIPLADRAQLDKLSLLGQMATSVAHEISNPLAAIVASAQTLLAFAPDDNGTGTRLARNGAEQREDLELILAEARRAGDIMAGLLAFARRQPPEQHAVALPGLVERVAGLVRHHLATHDIRLDTPRTVPGPPAGSLAVLGDRNRLQQLLLNLIVNAQQAMAASAVGKLVRVRFGTPRRGDVELVVEDDGPGVPAEVRDRVFEPFFTTKPDGQGTGLGLAIAVDIVRGHGGEIRLEDRPGGGARFVVRLPAYRADDQNAAGVTAEAGDARALDGLPKDSQSTPIDGRPHVLLVDDEPGILHSVGRFLRAFGYDVDAVDTGERALDALAMHSYDAIVCDLRMPELSGEALYEVVQSRFPEMATRIVFTSGDMMRPESCEFIERTGCPSLGKPYELTDLTDILSGFGGLSTQEPVS